MKDGFELLAALLDQSEPEVEGRAQEEAPESLKLKLRDLARGALAPEERLDLLDQLKENRHWIPLLADEVRALRAMERPETRQHL